MKIIKTLSILIPTLYLFGCSGGGNPEDGMKNIDSIFLQMLNFGFYLGLALAVFSIVMRITKRWKNKKLIANIFIAVVLIILPYLVNNI